MRFAIFILLSETPEILLWKKPKFRYVHFTENPGIFGKIYIVDFGFEVHWTTQIPQL